MGVGGGGGGGEGGLGGGPMPICCYRADAPVVIELILPVFTLSLYNSCTLLCLTYLTLCRKMCCLFSCSILATFLLCLMYWHSAWRANIPDILPEGLTYLMFLLKIWQTRRSAWGSDTPDILHEGLTYLMRCLKVWHAWCSARVHDIPDILPEVCCLLPCPILTIFLLCLTYLTFCLKMCCLLSCSTSPS